MFYVDKERAAAEEQSIVQHVLIEDRPVHEARLEGGTSVWVVIWRWIGLDGDVVKTAAEYGESQEAVYAALALYRRHKALFDAYLEVQRAWQER